MTSSPGNKTGATLDSAIERNIKSWWRKRMCWYGARRGKASWSIEIVGEGKGERTRESSVARSVK
jgi:hypothetical protein